MPRLPQHLKSSAAKSAAEDAETDGDTSAESTDDPGIHYEDGREEDRRSITTSAAAEEARRTDVFQNEREQKERDKDELHTL